MKKLLKRLVTLSLCICMLNALAPNTYAATKITSNLNPSYCVNVATDVTPIAGDEVTLWTYSGNPEHLWIKSGSTDNYYFRSNANTAVTLACAGDNGAVMENYNIVYGDWQRHQLYHLTGNMNELRVKGNGDYLNRLCLGTATASHLYNGYPIVYGYQKVTENVPRFTWNVVG